MMKMTLKIALLALGGSQLVATAPAVNVPQTSAADYIFTAPRLTNHIHGVLVDATNYYGVIRSEDIDWTREAFAERDSIRAGRILPPSGGVGPVVKKGDVPTDLPFYVVDNWLDGDAPLRDGVLLFGDGAQIVTNILNRTTYTNGYTNAQSVITMPMEGGGRSAYTNSWRAYNKLFTVTNVVTNVVTNAFTSVDWCHGVDGVPFPVYSNLTYSSWWSDELTYKSFPNVKVFAHAREELRGTARLADHGLMGTNATLDIVASEYDAGGHTYHEPSRTNHVTYPVGGIYSRDDTARGGYAKTYNADIPTRFTTELVTTGGAQRVSIEAAYANGLFTYSFFNTDATNVNNDVYVYTNCIVRLAEPTLDLSGTQAVCRVEVDSYGLCAACAEAAGVPAPPRDTSYRAAPEYSESWSYSCWGFTIFYRITPSTKLPDW